MAVTQQQTVFSYTASGSATVFGYGCRILDEDDLTVTVDGVDQVIGIDYTVSGVGNAGGGDVTFLVAPTAAAIVTLFRATQVQRLTDYQTAGSFFAITVNADFDRALMVLQDMLGGSVEIANALRVPAGEQINVLPIAAARALKLLAFDALGQPVALVGVDAGSATALDLSLRSAVLNTAGGGQVGFQAGLAYPANTIGWALNNNVPGGGVNLLRYIPAAEWPAIIAGTSTTDLTTYVQAAFDAATHVHHPGGVICVNTSPGVKFRTGQKVTGAGKNKALVLLLAGGGTLAELAAYAKGSGFSRRFNPEQTVTGAVWTITTYTSTDGLAQRFKIQNNTANNHSAKTVTITGTDAAGAPQNEILALPGSLALATSVNVYRTVTTLVPSATIGADTMGVSLVNPYVNDVVFEDVGIILTHPSAAVTTTALQIGVDMRNVSRGDVHRCHSGNNAPVGGALSRADPTSTFECQGYPVVFGNVSSGSPAYSGGEVHTLRESSVYGGYKLIAQDEQTLSPNSAAHEVRVINCDIQGGHHLLVQESQYTTGTVWEGNCVQNCKKKAGDASSSYVYRIEGYGNRLISSYVEAGSGADFILRFGSASVNNHAEMGMITATSAAVPWSDAGVGNLVRLRADTGTVPGGYDSKGHLLEYYNKAALKATYKGSWVTTTETIDASNEMTVTRTGAGDYSAHWNIAQPNNDWDLQVALDMHANDYPGSYSFELGTQSTTSVRFRTYYQNGATTTQADPLKMSVTLTQSKT